MKRQALESRLGHVFGDPELLDLALTHSSWANEHDHGQQHNERLEFLGDAVLELCVSRELYHRFPQAREGKLTQIRSQLVSEKFLAQLARDIHLDQLIKLGKGEESQGGRSRDSVLSDAVEAVLAAVYLDGGFDAVQNGVALLYAKHWPQDVASPVRKDAKSELQEILQQRCQGQPVYADLASSGPDHAKQFEVVLRLANGLTFVAHGSSRKRAEQEAASKALVFLKTMPV